MSRLYVDLSGTVKHIGDRSLYFREEGATHDICIPLSQIEEPDAVSKGQDGIRCSEWILNRLTDEGKR